MGGSVAARNVGGMDQTIRLGLGTALVMMWIFGPIGWWGVLGFLPLITGLTRVCPVYPLFGINTCPAPPPPEADTTDEQPAAQEQAAAKPGEGKPGEAA